MKRFLLLFLLLSQHAAAFTTCTQAPVCTTSDGLLLDNQRASRFFELSTNGNDYVSLRAPATLAAPYTLTLPVDDGTASQVLATDGSGILSWTTPTTGTVTSVNITQPAAGITTSGGPITSSGSITLALANDLAALEGLTGTGIAKRTGVDTWALQATVGVSDGGTGLSATPTNGQIAIGNGSGYTLATLTGTANQVNVTNGAGTITLSTPQNIGTGSSPTFNSLTLTTPLTVPNGGTGAATLAINNVLLGNGTSALQVVAPGASGNALFSDGTTWASDGVWHTSIKTANYTAINRDRVVANSTGGAFTITLPASPVIGWIEEIDDYAGTWATNNVTVAPNGADKINGVAANLTLDVNGGGVQLIYLDSTRGWGVY